MQAAVDCFNAHLDCLRAIVVGGSIGGLAAGLALRSIGCDVEIFERSPLRVLKDRGAGLVVQSETIDFLEKHEITTWETVSVPTKTRQYLNRDGSVIWQQSSYQLMTSWDTLYQQMKNAFPHEHYHQNSKLVGFEQDVNQVIARFADGREETCDVLVGADGANSACRRQLLPDVVPLYAGYVAWRGVVDECDLSPDVAEVLSDKFTFFQAPNTHILCYLIPGVGGELSPGKRRLNWVWYWNVPKGEALQRVLTDRTGLFRDYSLPQGKIQPELVEQQQAIVQEILPDVFQHLFEQTKEPFIQPIYDLSVPRMAFGRVCLIGDAAFVPRPHTAASTSKAIANAVELAGCVQASGGNVVAALTSWEPSQLELGNYLKVHGKLLGERAQFGRS